MIGDIRSFLLIPHLKIQNANALSSPFTIGFPAMTAWLGCAHALERQLKGLASGETFLFSDLSFQAVGVVSHQMDLQTYKGDNDFVLSIVGTGNPLDKDGSRLAFIEEARCHLDVSLIIEINDVFPEQYSEFLEAVSKILHGKMKVAGGGILSFATPEVHSLEDGNDEELNTMLMKLMPGYALKERRELMQHAMQCEGQDALEALIDYLAIHHVCEKDEDGNVTWSSHRKTYQGNPIGWVVPIATGFQAISEPGNALNQRDPELPHCFAESVVTLGEFVMLHRIENIEDVLWRYQYYQAEQLYLCEQEQFQTY